ncbi:Crinkler (CRN) family protein [Phytophthora cinnamomi]|uniref:Crinkler (CRN) family protein n=1 Tax=Phytophthora cinnamomi TaxID=4785 RepID=UPI003559D752|nr:Crinkler (CRN) family protein [Phytophthora cinnamomi]
MKLKCIVVNNGEIVRVIISEDKDGQDLKFALEEQARLGCSAVSLELFVTKTPDGSWITITEEHRRQMKAGFVPYEIFKVMNADNIEISGMREVGDNDNDSFCFKAHPLWPYRTPQSPATNAILMVRQRDSSDFSVDPAHTTEDSERQTPIYRTLTVGLVMNLTSDPLDSNEVHAQCKHFSAMFEHLSQATTQAVGIMTNVLVVCVLECSEGVMNLFGSDKTKLLEDYKHIQDVVLVDLTSSEGRAQFFGFDRRNKEGQLLVDTLEKTAGKIVEPRAKKKRKL